MASRHKQHAYHIKYKLFALQHETTQKRQVERSLLNFLNPLLTYFSIVYLSRVFDCISL